MIAIGRASSLGASQFKLISNSGSHFKLSELFLQAISCDYISQVPFAVHNNYIKFLVIVTIFPLSQSDNI
jgi:hypothetical protein